MHYLLDRMMHNSPSYRANTAVIQEMIGTVNIELPLVDNSTEFCIIMAYTADHTSLSDSWIIHILQVFSDRRRK